MTKRLRTALIWLGLVAVFFVLFTVGQVDDPGLRESFETFRQHVEEDRVVSIRVHNNEIHVKLSDGRPSYTTLGVVNDEITQLVSDHGGMVTWGEPRRHVRTMLTILLPLVLIGAFIWYFAKKSNTAQTGIFSLSKSRAREVTDGRDVSLPINIGLFHPQVGPRTGVLLVAAAGPISNLCIAMLSIVLLLATASCFGGAASMPGALYSLLDTCIWLNILLAVFNMIPAPPLDGSRIVDALMPDKFRRAWDAFCGLGPVTLASCGKLLSVVGCCDVIPFWK